MDRAVPEPAPGAGSRIDLPIAGWYADPYIGGHLRWWDGRHWTPTWAPLPAPLPATLPPYGYPQRDRTPPLDRAMARMRATDPRPWGWRPVVVPCATAVAAIIGGTLATHIIHPRTFDAQFVATIVINIIIYGMLGAAIYVGGRDVAARNGGWATTFGLRRPRLGDLGYIGAGIGVALIARIVVSIVANALTHGQAAAQSENLHLVRTTNPVAVDALLVVVVVILAPLLEETIFRGMLLRTFMTRVGFWPAAAASTFIFAMFHTYEVDTLAGALTLAAVVATLGLTNCCLVRLTDRLAPGMFVHAAFNALATAVLIYQASR